MAVIDQVTRPFSWLRGLKASAAQSAVRAVSLSDMSQTAAREHIAVSRVQIVGNCMKLPQRVDASCYEEVIAKARHLVTGSSSGLIIDLRDVERIDTAGYFALHCVAMIARGEPIPDAEQGWRALRTVGGRNRDTGTVAPVRLVNASPQVEILLRTKQFDQLLAIGPA